MRGLKQEDRASPWVAGNMLLLIGPLKRFSVSCMLVKDCEYQLQVYKFQQVGKLANIESVNNEDQLYTSTWPVSKTSQLFNWSMCNMKAF